MKEHVITVDVYGRHSDQAPRYRVYVDNNLLTERDFIWPGHEIFVRENIVVNLEPGQHNLTVEHINNTGSIQPKNIVIDGTLSSWDFVTTE